MTNIKQTQVNGSTFTTISGVEFAWENLYTPRADLRGNRVFDIQFLSLIHI